MSKILVVDDEPDILTILNKELTSAHYHVVSARTGQEGIDRNKEECPDLILMDVLLPDMNGAEAIKILQAYPEYKNIPVIFLTAMVKPDEESQGSLKINVDDRWYLTIAKPFDRIKLLSIIDQQLAK
jgi:CheY-like chemotaxis protein